jgi:hypothetical protein
LKSTIGKDKTSPNKKLKMESICCFKYTAFVAYSE